jgi:hypothetical protein
MDRLIKRGQLTRPVKPFHTESEHNHNHHAVHLACTWLHELTNASIEHIHDAFAKHQKHKTKMDQETLHGVSQELLEVLYSHDQSFTPSTYASLYHHIAKGLISKETTENV